MNLVSGQLDNSTKCKISKTNSEAVSQFTEHCKHSFSAVQHLYLQMQLYLYLHASQTFPTLFQHV